jgi:hypothetical protein
MVTVASGEGKQGTDGADLAGLVGRIIHYSLPPAAGAGGRVWELRRGEWSEVPDPIKWPPASCSPADLVDAVESSGFVEASSWGDTTHGQVAAKLFAGKGETYLVLLVLADAVNVLLVADVPSLLALLGAVVPLVLADTQLSRLEKHR